MVEETHATESEEVRHPDGRIEHPGVRYEHTDASFGWILGIILSALCLGIVILYVVSLFFKEYGDYQAAVKKSSYPLASAPSKALPREPRLEQVNRLAGIERGNVYLLEEVKEEALHTYGRTSEPGYVHIPIDRAMKLVQKKLPVRGEVKGDHHGENGLVDSGASNSGRMFREEPAWYEH